MTKNCLIPSDAQIYRPFLRSLFLEGPIFGGAYLWSAICFKIMTRYTCGFFPRILTIIPATRYTCVFLSRIFAFYSQVYDYFLTNAHIYAHKKAHIQGSTLRPVGSPMRLDFIQWRLTFHAWSPGWPPRYLWPSYRFAGLILMEVDFNSSLVIFSYK